MAGRIALGLSAFLCAGLMCFAEAAETTRAVTLDFSLKALRAEERYLADDSLLNTPFHLVSLGDLEIMTEPGEPCLPVKVVHVYVPRGSEISGVVVESQSAVSLPGEYLLMPGQREVPLSSFEPAEAVMPNQEIYASDIPYPASPVSVASVGSMAGRTIASLRVFPIQYVPAERRLVFNQRIAFRVMFKDAGPFAAPAVPRETASVAAARNEIVAKAVENGLDIEADFPSTGTLEGPTAVEYLLICHENHADEYSLLTNWKTRKGVPAAVKTWQGILAEYSGRDNAEKVRNCIKDYHLNHSTMWVTLSGSAPKAYDYLRGCYGSAEGTVDDFIVCDLYFSDLDGTWNDDNDAYWGETTDGTDLYPDVYVGRLPENTGIQCSTAVHKVLTYEGCLSLPRDYQLAMLFMAEWVDTETDGAIEKNMIDDESAPARFDPIQKLYQSSGNLNHTSAMSALNSGKGIVNHYGHGMPGKISIGGEWLTMDDFMALTNAPCYTIFYTAGCEPAAIDVTQGCLGRSFVESPNGGGFFVGNSSPGFYWQGNPGYGTADFYDREFFKSMFVRGYCNLGVVHADAKVQRIPYSGEDGTNRWTQFSMNLLGDPETPVWVDTPKIFVVSHPTEIEVQDQTFTVSVSSGGSPVGQARVCLWKGDDEYQVGQTASDGSATFSIAPADTGMMLVTAAKSGYLPYLGSTAVEDASSGVAPGGLGAAALRVTPNPTRGGATTRFLLPRYMLEARGGTVEISIYDVRGRLLAGLSSKADSHAGSITWEGRTARGAQIPPGIYFLKARCGDASAETKLVILR